MTAVNPKVLYKGVSEFFHYASEKVELNQLLRPVKDLVQNGDIVMIGQAKEAAIHPLQAAGTKIMMAVDWLLGIFENGLKKVSEPIQEALDKGKAALNEVTGGGATKEGVEKSVEKGAETGTQELKDAATKTGTGAEKSWDYYIKHPIEGLKDLWIKIKVTIGGSAEKEVAEVAKDAETATKNTSKSIDDISTNADVSGPGPNVPEVNGNTQIKPNEVIEPTKTNKQPDSIENKQLLTEEPTSQPAPQQPVQQAQQPAAPQQPAQPATPSKFSSSSEGFRLNAPVTDGRHPSVKHGEFYIASDTTINAPEPIGEGFDAQQAALYQVKNKQADIELLNPDAQKSSAQQARIYGSEEEARIKMNVTQTDDAPAGGFSSQQGAIYNAKKDATIHGVVQDKTADVVAQQAVASNTAGKLDVNFHLLEEGKKRANIRMQSLSAANSNGGANVKFRIGN